MTSQNNKTKWKFRPKRWWITLIAIWLGQSALRTLLYYIAENNLEAGVELERLGNTLMILFLIVFSIFCISNDISWSIWKRVLWVFGVWIGQAILMFGIGYLIINMMSPIFVDMKLTFFSSIPFYIWGMRRSKHFMEET